MNVPDHEFTPPIDLSQAEASRLRGLALAFRARWVPVGHWAFTAARGRKFEILWRTGWHAVAGGFFHPAFGLNTLAQAVALGRVMKTPVPAGYSAEELERDNPHNAWMHE